MPTDAQTRMPADAGYAKGVPMGGDLQHAPDGKSPTFLVAAMKDPLERQSRPHPDHQGLGRRRRASCRKRSTTWPGRATASPGADGKLPPVGNTVDVENAIWTNTIGAPELIAVVEGPGLRSVAARLLLRARDRNPDAALDGLRPEALRHQDAARGPDDRHRTRLYLTDLVHALTRNGKEPHATAPGRRTPMLLELRRPC